MVSDRHKQRDKNKVSSMIYYNGVKDYYANLNHEVVVCPCDCSGLVSRGAVRLMTYTLGERVANYYVELCNGNRMTTGTTEYLFRGQKLTPMYVLYWPLSPNAGSSLSFRAYVDCVEDLAEAVKHFGFEDVGVPWVPGLRGGWEEQETKLLDTLEGVKDCEFTLYYGLDRNELDEVEGVEIVKEEVTLVCRA
jgi:hypothetical protein